MPRASTSRSIAITTEWVSSRLAARRRTCQQYASGEIANEDDDLCLVGPVGPVRLRGLGHGGQGPAIDLGAARPRWSRGSSDLKLARRVNTQEAGRVHVGLLALQARPCHEPGGE